MKTLTYLAVLEPSKDGGYGIFFPDLPGCISFSKTIGEALENAEEAASLHVYGLEEDKEEIPEPTVDYIANMTCGNIILPVTIHPDLYRAKRENERVRTNITIPLWLKKEAEAKKVNYSRLLETALLDFLHIPQRYR